MISVVMPTMWYPEGVCDRIGLIAELDCIGEIIVINNNVGDTPSHPALLHPKVKIQNQIKNIYVTPAWNLGASLAQYEIISFYSDDVEININVFPKTYNFMNDRSETVGVVGLLAKCEGYESEYNRFYRNDEIDFLSCSDPDPTKRAPPLGYGNLFFVHKKNWRPLPEKTKIFHGEVFIWNYLNERKLNYMIVNCKMEAKMHVTWLRISEIDPEYNRIVLEDQQFCESAKFQFEDV
jgi:hypothetical protein